MSLPLPDLMDSREGEPQKFRITAPPRDYFNPATVAERVAADRVIIRQWDDLVTAHHGEIQERATVWISGHPHEHEGYIIARDYSLDHHCEHCYQANKLELSPRASKSMPQPISYALEIVRRARPSVLVSVPLPVPQNRNPRIQKKWAKQAAGKTGWGFKTETVRIEISKPTLWRLRKMLAERDALARYRGVEVS